MQRLQGREELTTMAMPTSFQVFPWSKLSPFNPSVQLLVSQCFYRPIVADCNMNCHIVNAFGNYTGNYDLSLMNPLQCFHSFFVHLKDV